MSIAARLKHAREALGLSITDLSRRTGYSEDAIKTWEKGSGIGPSHHTISALADAMGMDPRILSGDPHFPHGYIEACLDPWRGVSDEDRHVIEQWMLLFEQQTDNL